MIITPLPGVESPVNRGRVALTTGPMAEEVWSPMHGENTCGCGCGEMPRTGNRYIHGHNSRRATAAYIVDANGCWIWQRSFWKSNGRPRMKVDGRWRQAYKVYYERAIGPVPDGLTLDHVCTEFRCVNPDHLEPVTLRENQWRAGLIKLTDSERALVATSTAPAADVALYYGIATSTVYCIRARARRLTQHEASHGEVENAA